jgi:autotransporter translocation and assembly factor TamB
MVGRFDGTTLDGRLSGSGRLSWDGDTPWRRAAERQFARPREAASRPEPRGHHRKHRGRGFEATAPWTARVSKLSGSLYGRPLTGSGEIAHRNGAFELKRLQIANAGSRVDIDGLWGPNVDLRWSANLKTLALIDPSLQGELVSAGSARGPDSSDIKAEASVRNLVSAA